jgi:carotenoid cleavage dioxygenase-like enzyme
MHDFLMTEARFVFVFHPLHPDTLIVVADRDGATPARVFGVAMGFMCSRPQPDDRGGDVVVVDYVGQSDPITPSASTRIDPRDRTGRDIADRPLARVHLEHRTPPSFHGCWSPTRCRP